MSSPKSFDVVIIGGGYAGLSAATSIVRQNHSTLLLDSQQYRNATGKIRTLATWDEGGADEWREKGRRDLERYGCVIYVRAEVERVSRVGKNGEEFKVSAADGKSWIGRKLILAMGVEDVFLGIPGFHCLYCNGWEERGAVSSGMLAEGDTGSALYALHLARQGLRLSENVTIYTLGNEELADDIRTAIREAGTSAPLHVDARKVMRFEKGTERAEVKLYFGDGTEKIEAWIAHKPQTRIRGTGKECGSETGDLVGQLGLEVVIGAVKVSPPFDQTSVKGVFAAGDMASPIQFAAQALMSGTATGAGAPLQIQAEELNQKCIF